MTNKGRHQSSFYLQEWLVQPQLNQISRSGAEQRLNPKTMDVLLYLVDHPGEVVSKENVIEVIWGGSFVTDDVLISAVYELRKAFGDSAKNPRFIQTIPKGGYRLIAQIREPVRNEAAHERPYPKRSVSVVWLVPILLLILVGLGWLYLQRNKPKREPRMPVPLTSYLGLERSPSFSPDGERVAFSWDGEEQGSFDIYVRQVGVGGPVRLTTNSSPDLHPAWSPDGRFIAFLRVNGPRENELRLVPSLGGSLGTRVAEVSTLGRLSWSPDGEWLVLTARVTQTDPLSVVLVSIRDGKKKRLTFPDAGVADRYPIISPDGRTLVFSRQTDAFLSNLYTMQLSADLQAINEPVQLTFESLMCFDPVWTREGLEVIFSLGSQGDRQLFRVPIEGGQLTRIPFAGENGWDPALSAQGNRLAYSKVAYDADIWRLKLPNSMREEIPDVVAERFIFSTRWDVGPVYSPDGTKVAFASERTGTQEIWVCDSDRTHPVQLTSFNGPACAAPSWSPDGSRIGFVGRPGGNSDIYIVNAEGGGSRRLTFHEARDILPSWSRNGQWIYFQSSRSGENDIWKISPEASEPVQVTINGGSYAIESLDGQTLFFSKQTDDGQRLFSMPVDGGEPTEIKLAPLNGLSFDVAVRGIFVISEPEGVASSGLHFVDFRSRQVSLITELNDPVGKISLSPDGEWILFAERDVGSSDIILVDDFR